MIAILQAKFKVFLHRPWNFIIMTIVSFASAFVFSQMMTVQSESGLSVPIVAGNEDMKSHDISEQLLQTKEHHFYWLSEEELAEQLARGNIEVGIILHDDYFEVIEGIRSGSKEIVEQFIRSAYQREERLMVVKQHVNEQFSSDEAEEKMTQIQSASLFSVKQKTFKQKETNEVESSYQPLFGMTLFLVIYTIAYPVLNIFVEREYGVWDRMILSPMAKWQMYMGNLIYSFLKGYIQVVVIFSVFYFFLDVDFGGKFIAVLLLIIPYVFTIVALNIFLGSLVKTIQQFNALIPIVTISMAMLGGALWPLEVVESKIILMLSKFMPIKYGIDLLYGLVAYDLPFSELMYPFSILLLMGVLMMGLGIHFIEKRHV